MKIDQTTEGKERRDLAAHALCGLLASGKMFSTKKQMCDTAIAYADMMLRRLAEIPIDAQERAEAGQRKA